MKTGKEWFALLTKKQQKQYEANVQMNMFEHKIETKYQSFEVFITGAFVWTETPEGEYYWKQIAIKTF